MPHEYYNLSFKKVWIRLKDGIDTIYHVKTMDVARRMELYTLVHFYCVGHSQWTPRHALDVRGADLYEQINYYLRDYVEKIFQSAVNLKDEDLLQFYTTNWEEYRFSSAVLGMFCSSLSRHWVRCEFESGNKNVYELFTLAMVIWKEMFLTLFKDRLIRTCLDLINDERDQKVINNQLIRTTIQSYAILFLDNMDLEPLTSNNNTLRQTLSTVPILDVYQKYFEVRFIQETEKFYRIEATNLSNKSIIEYFEKVNKRVEEEVNRLNSYLFPSTLPAVMRIVEEVFLVTKIDDIVNEMKMFLNTKRYEDAALLCQYTRHFPNVNNELRQMVETHIDLKLTECIARITAEAITDPIAKLQRILNVRKEVSSILQKSLNGDPKWTAALNRIFVESIKQNAVPGATGSASIMAKLLARYSDMLLKKSDQPEREIEAEDMLDQIAAISNYIENQDDFDKYYNSMLANRLISRLSASDELEESMILKLKKTYSLESTRKWQRMFNDVQISKSLMEQYRKFCKNQQQMENTVNFQVMVLSSNSWPFSVSFHVNLPNELKPTFDSFTKFYTHQHNSRKLIWVHHRSKGELEMTNFTQQKHTLQVSMYQMAILLLYNRSLEWTVEQIQDETQIKAELLLPVLVSLLESEVLTCNESNGENVKEIHIKMHSIIQLTDDFKHKERRINLYVPLKLVEQKDIEKVEKIIDEDRKSIIQAAIVRTMKAYQSLKQALLIQKVIEQLSSRFQPDIPQITKYIEILIEKGYLERQSDDNEILRYLA